jgi:hypothetical protein
MEKMIPVARNKAVTDILGVHAATRILIMESPHTAVVALSFSRRRANELEIDALVKSFAETNRKLEDAIIGRQDDDITRRVQNGGADLAVIQMLLHGIPRFVRQCSIQIF